jgi:hypothetical protein
LPTGTALTAATLAPAAKIAALAAESKGALTHTAATTLLHGIATLRMATIREDHAASEAYEDGKDKRTKRHDLTPAMVCFQNLL